MVSAKAHAWVGAVTVPLPDNRARGVLLKGYWDLPQRMRVDVLDVYCAVCHRPYETAGEECPGRSHGGPSGRRRRKP